MEAGGGRSMGDLVVEQVAGIDAWAREQRGVVDEVVARSREMRLDSQRRLQARRREQQAVLARADEHLARSGSALSQVAPLRAVVAHRSRWLRERVAGVLTDSGVLVVAGVEDGAGAVGALVVEQPDLLFVEDRLATTNGLELALRARHLAPRTHVGVHVADAATETQARRCGIPAVFPRRTSPADMAAGLLALLTPAGPDR